jgi:hypothetical protein
MSESVAVPGNGVDVAAIEQAAAAPPRSHKKRPGPGRPPKSESEPRPEPVRKYKRAADVPVKFELPAQQFDPRDLEGLVQQAAVGVGQLAQALTLYLTAVALGEPRKPRADDATAFGGAVVQLALLYLPDVSLTTGQLAMLTTAALGVAMVGRAEPVTVPDAPAPVPTSAPDPTSAPAELATV